MKTKTPPKPESLFRAAADETRLRILSLLSQGELCVCDLVGVLGVPQPTVSRHLAYLRKVGMVTGRKEAVWCYYALAPANTEFQKLLMECIRACETPRMAKDIQNLKRGSNCCS